MANSRLFLCAAALSALFLLACTKANESGPPADGAGAMTPQMPAAGAGATAPAAGSGSGAETGSAAGTAAPAQTGGSTTPAEPTAGTGAPQGPGSFFGDNVMRTEPEPVDIPEPNADALGELEQLDPGVDWEALTLVYPIMHSAFDGEHLFQVPVHVQDIDTELSDWQSIPSGAVAFDPDPDTGGVLITVLAPEPEVTIAVSTGSIGGTAPLYITNATPEEWATGEYRYRNGAVWEFPTFDPAEFDIFDPSSFEPPPPPTDLSCVNCHTTGAMYFEIQHTPTQIAHLSDEELIKVFTMGIKPPTLGYRFLPMEFEHLYGEMHTWEATDEEKKGIVVYLRSLTPEGQGDFLLPTGIFAPPE